MGRLVVKRDKLQAKLRELGAANKVVVVGVLGNDGSAAHTEQSTTAGREVTVAEVAQWNYFGTSRIPARPWFLWMKARHGAQLAALQKRLAEGIVTDKLSLDQALALLGEAAVGMTKQTIADRIPPRNADSTIAKKGSDVPLIDSGQLRGSITYQVRNGH